MCQQWAQVQEGATCRASVMRWRTHSSTRGRQGRRIRNPLATLRQHDDGPKHFHTLEHRRRAGLFGMLLEQRQLRGLSGRWGDVDGRGNDIGYGRDPDRRRPSSCATGMISCSGTCIDPQSDNGNCGGCDLLCPGGCSMGHCTVTIATGSIVDFDVAGSMVYYIDEDESEASGAIKAVPITGGAATTIVASLPYALSEITADSSNVYLVRTLEPECQWLRRKSDDLPAARHDNRQQPAGAEHHCGQCHDCLLGRWFWKYLGHVADCDSGAAKSDAVAISGGDRAGSRCHDGLLGVSELWSRVGSARWRSNLDHLHRRGLRRGGQLVERLHGPQRKRQHERRPS